MHFDDRFHQIGGAGARRIEDHDAAADTSRESENCTASIALPAMNFASAKPSRSRIVRRRRNREFIRIDPIDHRAATRRRQAQVSRSAKYIQHSRAAFDRCHLHHGRNQLAILRVIDLAEEVGIDDEIQSASTLMVTAGSPITWRMRPLLKMIPWIAASSRENLAARDRLPRDDGGFRIIAVTTSRAPLSRLRSRRDSATVPMRAHSAV